MTPAPQSHARPVARPRGPLVALVSLAFGLLLSVACSLVVGTVIEWIGMNWWWREQGLGHSRDMVAEDLAYLAEYRRSLLTDDTVAFAARWAEAATRGAQAVGLVFLIRTGAEPIPPRTEPFRRRAREMLRTASVYLLAAIYVWQDAFVRLAIVVLALPAFVLAFVLGLVDGLARRDIRKWSGGRESSFVYHHAKRILWPAFAGGFFLYLTWPTGGFNPAWMVLPFCAAAAWTVSLAAATFKKYL